jgi:PAS domain S-box-containing protein
VAQRGEDKTRSATLGPPVPPATEDGDVPSVLAIVRKLKDAIAEKDRIINERTRELKEAGRRFENIVASIGDAVLVLDGTGTIETVNEATVELTGHGREELVGRPASDLWNDPSHRELFTGERFRDLLRRGVLQRHDMEWRTKGGDAIAISWTGSPLRDGDRLLGLVGVARGPRDQRRLEEEKLRAVRALAASVAHEIRNPLGAIQNSVALLLRDLPLKGDDRTLMDIVFGETQRIGGIVSQFIDFARPAEVMLAPGDLGALLQEVATIAEKDERAAGQGTASGPRVELFTQVDPSLPPVRFDPDKLRQVIWNLVSNALDAQGSRVALRARRAEGGVEVRVADDGAGMTPDVLARLFEPFRTTKARGTGLGLTISKAIIEKHGGSIRIESAPGEGTSVSFTLPGADL